MNRDPRIQEAIDSMPDCVKALSTESLNKRASGLAKVIHRSGVCLTDREARAYAASQKGCAHAGDVDVLQRRVDSLRTIGLA